MVANTYSDCASGPHDRKFVDRYIVYLYDGMLTYKTKQQPVVAQATIEAEFIKICLVLETVELLMNFLKIMSESENTCGHSLRQS